MKKILIVDDEPFMLKLTGMILSKKHVVLSASSGSEAVELFERERPDLVLSDLRMPGMDGYELYRCLQEKSGDPVPFIFMTGDESDESEIKGFEMGAADYIRKPVKADVLLRRIDNILQSYDQILGLKKAASMDPLTKLLNKGAAQEEIAELCEKVPGALMMIDLDNFKLVNDIYGHAMGDRILIRFSEIIRGMIRSVDLAGRMGGDEFIAYLQDVKEPAVVREKTAYLNEELLASAKEYMGEDMGIPLGASVGAVFAPSQGTDFVQLCRRADQALYTVKQHGKHGAGFYEAAHLEGMEEAPGKSVSHMQKILGERHSEPGALLMDFNRFQGIYQFLARQDNNRRKHIQLLQFTLNSEQPEEGVAEQFRDMLRHSLRSSDCVMQNGVSQFFVLLMNAGEEECRILEARLRRNWESIPVSAHCGYDCDAESMG